jgi:hypothetical protein
MIPRSGEASRGERVGSLGAPVSGSSVRTVNDGLPPVTVPWLEMLCTPAGMGGLFISALKTMMRRLPAGSVPMLIDTASNGASGAADVTLLNDEPVTLAAESNTPLKSAIMDA